MAINGSIGDMIIGFAVLGFGLDIVVGFFALICGRSLNLEWSIGSLIALLIGAMGTAVLSNIMGDEISLYAMMSSFGIIFMAWAMGAILIKVFEAP